MKKLISIISIILAVCLTASCGNVNETVTEATNTTCATVVTTTDSTTKLDIAIQTTETNVQTTGSSISGGEHATVTIDNYDEYLSFVKSNDMPDDFITYDIFSDFGKFQTFICEPFTTGDECKEYIYVVEDDNGYSVMFSIELAEKELVTENYIFMSDNISDYRFVEYDNVVHSIVNDLKYSYARGKLFAITALFGNIKIVMTISGGRFENYPINGADTFISRLLSPATAKAAAAELVASIATAEK